MADTDVDPAQKAGQIAFTTNKNWNPLGTQIVRGWNSRYAATFPVVFQKLYKFRSKPRHI